MNPLFSTVSITDEELAKRAAAGDERAFAELVARYSVGLLSVAYRFLNDRGEAEDAVQEVFIKVFKALPKSRLDLPFKPWIYRIAANECINRAKRRREFVADVEGLLERSGTSGPSPFEAVLEQERFETVRRAIRSLPTRYRPVVFLRYTEGLSFREIGETIRIPEGTAKTFFFRAKDALKASLAGV
ncbi:MAG: RNA polymerase sigma factor [Candidatus Aquicultorales bacterium]